ncbi:MAG: anaerobic ribonucleoside triphosphate reductase [Ruminococcus sp.]|nr:anaerobic ribonucleoside triphosphate reductase [Ruminococcus sp.]MDY3214683.1 anaerobic ribonucleoside triphosphate reductase [Ruminococcus sp.]
MIIHIIKRDGRKVPFNIEKIANAVFKAAQSCGGSDFNEAMDVAVKTCELYEKEYGNEVPTVEKIQDIVEKVLIENGHAKTAKAYILYRYERTRSREMKTNLMRVLNELTFNPAKDSDIKRENANIDGDTAMGTMLKYGSVSAKEFYEMYVLEERHAKAHKNGDIHIHDLDFLTLTTTCCQIDLLKLFHGGFSTGHGFLREPNDIASYSALACIAIQSNQNDQHGGQSVPNFDYSMAEGVRKTYSHRYVQNIARALDLIANIDNADETAKNIFNEIKEKYNIIPNLANDSGYTEKEFEKLCEITDTETAEKIQKFAVKNAQKETDRATYQAMEALIHNLNTMNSRAGAQTPFSSINYGTDTSPEGRMVIKNVLLAQEAGLGNGETPIFPIHIFKIKEGINYNKDDINYDLFKLACRVSAKRLFPNFSFLDAPYNLQYYKEGDYNTEVAYMGCRTRVIGNVYDPTREIVTGRGNLSFTSINLPRLAIKADHNVGAFFDMLDEMMDLTIEQLLHRFKIQSQKKVRNFPFLMGQGVWIDSDKLSADDTVGEILKHGTLSVGFIGLAETLKALIGKHHGESEEARELGLEIIQAMRNRLDEECKRTGLNFSLLATPAEGLSGRFVRMDAERYGIIEGVTDREYYTNSFHVPVYYPISAFEKIKIEAPYHALTNAGHISYIELDGDPMENLDAFEKVVRCMKEAGIGYGSINHPVDRDPVCGYTGIIGECCPMCGRKENSDDVAFDRIRRITGYLVGTIDRFNNAKRAEVNDRIKHNI